MIKSQIREYFQVVIDGLVAADELSSSSLDSARLMNLQKTKSSLHGDYASNIAMLLGSLEKKSPRALAHLIVDGLMKESEFFQSVQVAGPGFINIELSDRALAQVIPQVAKRGKDYGRAKNQNGQRVLIEYVSANPTGDLHLGHARPAIVGDALARLLRAAGFDVDTEFYVNDTGNQVRILARTIHKRYRELFGESIVIEAGEYPSEAIKDIARQLKDEVGDKWLNASEEEWLEPISRFGVDHNLGLIKKSLSNIDITIDKWFFEHRLHDDGSLESLVDAYEQRNMLYEASSAEGIEGDNKVRREESKAAKFAHLQEGGIFLKTSQFGDGEDRILKRKDGSFVYLAADLAYHHQKFKRGYHTLVDVFGADHAGHIGRIKAGMAALGHETEKLKFVLVQMVRLVREGKELRFSKRAGEVIALGDLINEVGKDVVRFVFLMRSANSQFDLDLDLVTKTSNDNPVFYVQYGHARMATILKRAKDEHGIDCDATSFGPPEQEVLILPEERELILKISELDEVVLECARSLEPQRLIYFCQELIKVFHAYFTKYRHSEKVISSDLVKTKARLALVFAVKQSIKNALSFLGLSAPDHMEQSFAVDEE